MDDCFGVKYVQIKNKLVPIMCFQRPHSLGLDLKPRKILRKVHYLILTTNFKTTILFVVLNLKPSSKNHWSDYKNAQMWPNPSSVDKL
jgi:hypothetical protein